MYNQKAKTEIMACCWLPFEVKSRAEESVWKLHAGPLQRSPLGEHVLESAQRPPEGGLYKIAQKPRCHADSEGGR